MARVGRLAGAILAETGGIFYLVGNTKTPLDWEAAGFEPPVEIDAMKRPFIRLSPRRSCDVTEPYLAVELEGERLPALLAERFVIPRTGSVSDRLWRLVTGDEDGGGPVPKVVEARWLGEVPAAIWEVVRETVLRCS